MCGSVCVHIGDTLDRKLLLLKLYGFFFLDCSQDVTNLGGGVEVLYAAASTTKSVDIVPICWIMAK